LHSCQHIVRSSASILTIDGQAREHDLGTVWFSASLAVFAAVADVLDWLVACSLAWLEVLDLVAHFHNDASALFWVGEHQASFLSDASHLMTGTGGTQFTHLWKLPVIEHEVHIW
jgi:hypothetical protein